MQDRTIKTVLIGNDKKISKFLHSLNQNNQDEDGELVIDGVSFKIHSTAGYAAFNGLISSALIGAQAVIFFDNKLLRDKYSKEVTCPIFDYDNKENPVNFLKQISDREANQVLLGNFLSNFNLKKNSLSMFFKQLDIPKELKGEIVNKYLGSQFELYPNTFSMFQQSLICKSENPKNNNNVLTKAAHAVNQGLENVKNSFKELSPFKKRA